MGPVKITWMTRLALVLARDVLFGFILQKGHALDFHRMLEALRIPHDTIWKLAFIVLAAGMLGLSILSDLSFARLQVIPMTLPAHILGTLIIRVALSTTRQKRLDGLPGGFVGLLMPRPVLRAVPVPSVRLPDGGHPGKPPFPPEA